MKIIISPAKKMRINTDDFAHTALPAFLPQTEQLVQALKAMSRDQLQALWKCNDKLATQNFERIQAMDLHQNVTPAIFAYEGIQYQYMAPNVFEQAQLDYISHSLRILSGFYGMLRPFDGVVPYRLEMQAKLKVAQYSDLYQFWGDTLAQELQKDDNCIINLASKEYSKAIVPHLRPETRFITCIFAERVGEKLQEKGTMCKMARGQMVRYLAEQTAQNPVQLQAFHELDFTFSAQESTENQYVFIKKESETC